MKGSVLPPSEVSANKQKLFSNSPLVNRRLQKLWFQETFMHLLILLRPGKVDEFTAELFSWLAANSYPWKMSFSPDRGINNV